MAKCKHQLDSVVSASCGYVQAQIYRVVTLATCKVCKCVYREPRVYLLAGYNRVTIAR